LSTLSTGLAITRPQRGSWGWVAAGFVGLMVLLRYHTLHLRSVHWDEFFFLSKIYSHLRGDLTGALQTGHVHAFTWLRLVSENEVTQIIAARTVMLGLQAATCWFIFAVTRRLFDRTAGFVAVFAYLSFSYVQDHGTAFRADPIAAFLVMGAIWVLLRERRGLNGPVLAGLGAALALMVTIKSFAYVPVLAVAILCLRPAVPVRTAIRDAMVFGATTALGTVLLYLLHKGALAGSNGFSATTMIAKNSARLLGVGELSVHYEYLEWSLAQDLMIWCVMLVGLYTAATALRDAPQRRRALGLLGLAAPLLTIPFYRNAFPYYYVFALAGPVVLCGGGAAGIRALFGFRPRLSGALVALIAASLVAGFGGRYVHRLKDRNAMQHQLIEVVHRMFPQPVPYIDRAAMIPSFPKVGFFMSTLGMEIYHAHGQPIMRELLVSRQPKFIIANTGSLKLERPPRKALTVGRYPLLPADAALLRENYVHHWGQIWVTGKRLSLPRIGETRRFEVLIPGIYTLESPRRVVIDGMPRGPGDKVYINQGWHTVSAEAPDARTTPDEIVLRWGSDLYRPKQAPLPGSLFQPFRVHRAAKDRAR
jgi:hypothetical protein